MRAIKFGGSSVADASRLRVAGALLAELRAGGPVTAVVSALAGVTDGLLGVAAGALSGDPGWRADLAALDERHREAFIQLTGDVPRAFEDQWGLVERDAAGLTQVRLALDTSARSLDAARFSGWGERLAVPLLAAAVAATGAPAYPVEDAPIQLAGREQPNAIAEPSPLATRAWLLPRLAGPVMRGAIPILPGYIARDAEGRLTTLGRNSSDYSAAMIAAALGATRLTLYSDVEGVYTADPRVVAGAHLLPALTYEEAARVAGLGAKALHPRAVEPLARRAIPLELRAVTAPHAQGTDIGPLDRLARQRGRDAAWVIAARPAATADAAEVSALWLPAWPLSDADAPDQAPVALTLMARLGAGSAPRKIAGDETRMTVAATRGDETVRALHAALVALTPTMATGQERLAAGV